jgi:hypothetical protein
MRTTTNWAWFLPRTAILAVAEGLVAGLALGGTNGGQILPDYWLLMTAIIGSSAFVAAGVAYRVAGRLASHANAVAIAWVVGAIVGFVAGYLLQPRGGPT